MMCFHCVPHVRRAFSLVASLGFYADFFKGYIFEDFFVSFVFGLFDSLLCANLLASLLWTCL